MQLYRAVNKEELVKGLKVKSDTILIEGAYAKIIKELMDTHLSETAMIGPSLGSAGLITVAMYGIERLMDVFRKADKQDKWIERRLKIYKVKEWSEGHLLLSLKQLDY